jgi:hypothetical protein
MRTHWIYLLLFVVGTAAGAEVYRSVDANGNVIYSDRPANDDAQTIFIDTAIATPTVAEDENSDDVPNQENLYLEVDGPEVATEVGPSAEQIAAERMENCGIARDREARYIAAHRIYRGTEDNREYLTDAELDEIRAQAAADVEEWCS